MAYAMSILLAVFLCMAPVVVHVDSARLLLLAGTDPATMTANTDDFAATDDFGAQGADSAKDAVVDSEVTVRTGEMPVEFSAPDFDLTTRDSTEKLAYAGTLVPPTDDSFTQNAFPASSAAGTDRFPGPDATTESFQSADQESWDADSKASADEAILVGSTQRTVGSGNDDYRFGATKRDVEYPADSNASTSEFNGAEGYPQFGSDESGNLGSAEKSQLFEFEDPDNTP